MKKTILFIASLFVLSSISQAQTLYARQNGDWNNTSTWSLTGRTGASCGCTPSVDNPVIIDSRDVDVSNANANASSVVFTNTGANGDFELTIENGYRLRVLNSIELEANRNNNDVELIIQDNGSQVDIGGDFLMDMDNGERIRLTMTENTNLQVDGDLLADVDGNNGNQLVFDLACDGGNDHFHIDGDFTLDKDGGQAVQFNLSEDMDMNVDGTMSIDWDATAGNNQDLEFDMDDDASIRILGSMDINMNETVRGSCDVLFELNDRSAIEVGFNANFLVENANITVQDGDKLELILERDASFTVHGNMNVAQAGDGYLHLQLNNNNDGSAADAQWTVEGDLNISKTDGDATQLFLKHDADLQVSGDMTMTITGHDAGYQHNELQMQDQTAMNVGGELSIILNDARQNNLVLDMNDDASIEVGQNDGSLAYSTNISVINGLNLDWDLDRDASFRTYGNLTMVHGGDGTFDIDLNQNNNGGAVDAQFHCHGNMTLTKTDGDRFRIDLAQHSDMTVGGDLTINNSGHDSGPYDDEYIELSNDATLDIEGNLSFSMSATAGQNDLLIDLDHSSALYIGQNNGSLSNSLTLTNTNGNHTRIDVDRDAILEVYGNVDISHAGDGDLELRLDQNTNGSANDAQVRFDGDLTITKTNGDAFSIQVRNHSDLDIGGNLSYSSTGHDAGDWSDERIEVEEDATLDIDGNLSFSMDNPQEQNDIRLNIDDDAAMRIGIDDGSLSNSATFNMPNGKGIDFDVDRNGIFEVYGNIAITHGGTGNFDMDFGVNNGNSADAQVRIDGNLTTTKTNGDRYRLTLDHSSDLTIGGNYTINNSGYDNGAWGNDEIELADDANMDVDGSLSWTMNDATDQNRMILDLANNSVLSIGVDDGNTLHGLAMNHISGRGVQFELDHDAQLLVFGNIDLDNAGSQEMDIDLATNNSGTSTLRVDGDLDIVKTDGRRFRFQAFQDAVVDIGGNFSYNGSGHVGGDWNDENLTLRHDAGMDVDGDFSWTVNDNTQQNEMFFDIEDDAHFEVGSSLSNKATLTMTDGRFLSVRIDNSAVWDVNGDLQVVYADGHTDSGIGLNRSGGNDAKLNISGSLDLDNNQNSDLLLVRLDGDNSLLHVDGNIDLQSAAAADRIELELRSSSKIELGGNFVRSASPNNYGILDCQDNSIVVYNGAINTQIFAQDAGAGSDAFHYENVMINNSFGTFPQLTMEGLATVHGDILFRDGIVASTSANILVVEDGGDANDGVGTPTFSYVDGPMRKIGNDDFTFPLGDSLVWAPIQIDDLSTSTFEAEYFFEAAPDPGNLQAPLNNVSTMEYWQLDQTSGSATPDVTLHWKDQTRSSITDPTDLSVVHYPNGGPWEDLGQDALSYAGEGWIRVDNVSNFSPFTFGSALGSVNPLPIELLSFEASLSVDEVELDWVTASETNNDYFTIERSLDGYEFEALEQMPGAGNSHGELHYSTLDRNPNNGWNYYRLRQTDFDGTTVVSQVVPVFYKTAEGQQALLYPNPTSSNAVTIKLNNAIDEDVAVSIYDMSGKRVYRQMFQLQSGDGQVQLPVSLVLGAGTYIVNLHSNSLNESHKLFIK